MLETISGVVVCMFSDLQYPLSVHIMEQMLRHKLEVPADMVGSAMTNAEQLI